MKKKIIVAAMVLVVATISLAGWHTYSEAKRKTEELVSIVKPCSVDADLVLKSINNGKSGLTEKFDLCFKASQSCEKSLHAFMMHDDKATQEKSNAIAGYIEACKDFVMFRGKFVLLAQKVYKCSDNMDSIMEKRELVRSPASRDALTRIAIDFQKDLVSSVGEANAASRGVVASLETLAKATERAAAYLPTAALVEEAEVKRAIDAHSKIHEEPAVEPSKTEKLGPPTK